MKKDTKASLIVFVSVFVLAFVMTMFIPDDAMAYSTNGGLLSFLGTSVAKLVGIRTIISIAIATAVTLLVRIVDPEEKKEEKKVSKKTTTKKGAKWETLKS